MTNEIDRSPSLDRHAQIEFGRLLRDRLDDDHCAAMPSELEALLSALRLADDESGSGGDR